MSDIRKELDALDGQTIVLPSDVCIEVIEGSGDVAKMYLDELDRASDAVTKAIAGNGPIQGPIDYAKAWNELVIGGNKWPPKDKP